MYLVIFGPPGAGKGTQAQYISEHFEIPHISTGEIFRENIKNDTPLGVEAKRYTASGNLVPDSLTNAMVRDRIQKADCSRGALLDGYPRTIDQAREFDKMLAEKGSQLSAVINLKVPDGEIVQRLSKRGRSDDNPEAIKRRLQIYHNQTEVIVGYFRDRGLLHDIYGVGNIQEISKQILDTLDKVTHKNEQHS
ncbi:MAG: adenylate kinase [Ectothiorhodospiraceae bacterium]|nr:adenylate kinase [Ectothiorhodospiraceae bacterium]